MAPKRKATSPEDQRVQKKVIFDSAAKAGTQTQNGNDDDEFSDDDISESEDEDYSNAIKKFSARGKAKAPQAKVSSDHDIKADGLAPGVSDSSFLDLKPDHPNRPLWIDSEKGKIIMESFHPLAKVAQDFLTSIAEPQSRPSYMHEYALTVHSLYAAMSVGLTPNDIVNGLRKFLKTPLPDAIVKFIKESSQAYGRVKLVLKNNSYFLETADATILRNLLNDDEIKKLGIGGSDDEIITEAATKATAVVIPGTKEAAGVYQQPDGPQGDTGKEKRSDPEDLANQTQDDFLEALRAEDDDDDEEEAIHVHSVIVPKEVVEHVSRRCLHLGFPVLEEYDFNNDKINAKLEIDLKPGTRIRDYQEKSLAKMFGNGRARSGIIVLPCGAGKTLVGITAACTIRRSVVVLCTSAMSVVQWRNEFLKWSNISADDIAIFTADHKQKFSRSAGIIVTTYSMVTVTHKSRAYDTQRMMDFLQQREWGLMLLDEVHVVPASIFRKVGSSISSHCKLGLTATLLREDDRITDLNFLIGPKLYEANWMELADQGHIAKVQCAEVWCPMTTEFYQEYLKESSRKRALLYIMNPRKFQACQFLIDYHERRGDKIIVFSDNVYALGKYANKLGKFYIYGETPQPERMSILENFQHNDEVNTIFLSKIGDTSLDLPEATCLIQISSHYGSRRQEAQRLGRILRAKRRNDEGFNAFFYSLVSKDTQEMYYSSKRQAFLVDQGYAFKVITHLHGIEDMPNLAFSTASERVELLQEVMLQNESYADVEDIKDDLFSGAAKRTPGRGGAKKGVRRTAGTLSDLSGGQDMAYMEFNKSKNKELKKNKSLWTNLTKAQARERKARNEMLGR